VLSVLGLNNVKMTTNVTPCDLDTPTCLRFSYDPATYWKAYNVGSVAPARNASIAVMAQGDVTNVVRDLRTFERTMGLGRVPVTVKQVGLWSPDTSAAIEWNLDTQYTTGMAGAVKNLFIYTTTSLTTQDTALEFNRWVTDDLAEVANASFGPVRVLCFPRRDDGCRRPGVPARCSARPDDVFVNRRHRLVLSRRRAQRRTCRRSLCRVSGNRGLRGRRRRYHAAHQRGRKLQW
jgi:hypothetical protein